MGIKRPESSSISQNLARINARIDFSGTAQVPIMKLIAAIRKKLPRTATRNRAKSLWEAGGWTRKMKEMRIAVGTVSKLKRKEDSPTARLIHIHCTETGLI